VFHDTYPQTSIFTRVTNCSEKLLRDTLLRDERERQQQLSSPPPPPPLLTRRRYSHTPASSDFARTEYAHGSSLFRTAMSSSRSPSSSSSSEQDRESPVRRRLFYGGGGGDKEAGAYQQQQSPTSISPRTRPSRRTSPSPSPSPVRVKRRQESVDPITHSTANFDPTPTNVTNLRRNQSLQNTQHNRYGLHGPSEQGGWPGKRGRQSIRSGSESMISESFSASHSHCQSPSQTPTRTPNRANTSNNQHNPYYSPSSPDTFYSGVGAVSPSPPSFNRTRSQTDANTVIPNTPSPRRNNSSPSTLIVSSSHLKPTKKWPLPIGKVEEGVILPTPPPSPRVSLGASGNYSQRKKEGELELRMPGQGPAVGRNNRLRTDVAITQQSHQVLRSPTGAKKSNNNADGHSLSSESCSSVSSVSHLHVGCSCSSHSSLDEPLTVAPLPRVSHDHHLVQQTSTGFNARKASTQCRAIEGYVSFASVEGLGEPPLVRDEFDEDVRGKGRKGSVPFLPLGVLSAAIGWKRFLGGGDAGPGVEGPVVV